MRRACSARIALALGRTIVTYGTCTTSTAITSANAWYRNSVGKAFFISTSARTDDEEEPCDIRYRLETRPRHVPRSHRWARRHNPRPRPGAVRAREGRTLTPR